MVDDVFGELFLDDEADESGADAPIVPPVTVPAPADGVVASASPTPARVADAQTMDAPPATALDRAEVPSAAQPVATEAAVSGATASVGDTSSPAPVTPAQVPSAPVAPAAPEVNRSDRERGLANALNTLMRENHDVEAAALVSLDGFIMASALPEGMHEDRVGAMSAAILGLGERAAAELGRGKLSQVFIEGENGYVLLMAAGERAVLTCLADHRAKLGLVIFDMRRAAGAIGEVLG